MAASSRFAKVSDEDISEINTSAVLKATQNETKNGVELFKDKSASPVKVMNLEFRDFANVGGKKQQC